MSTSGPSLKRDSTSSLFGRARPEEADCSAVITYLVDMQMMAMFGAARARTEDEFDALLAASGLTLRRVVATASSVSIVEAEPSKATSGSTLPRQPQLPAGAISSPRVRGCPLRGWSFCCRTAQEGMTSMAYGTKLGREGT